MKPRKIVCTVLCSDLAAFDAIVDGLNRAGIEGSVMQFVKGGEAYQAVHNAVKSYDGFHSEPAIKPTRTTIRR